jgi:hypothetical protein
LTQCLSATVQLRFDEKYWPFSPVVNGHVPF